MIKDVTQLFIYQQGFKSAMQIFESSKEWPSEERYALTSQVRRSSRAICGILAEAWSKRRYVASFISKLADAEGEAAETRTWLDFAEACRYIDATSHANLLKTYRQISAGLVKMMTESESWTGPSVLREHRSEYEAEFEDS